MVIDANYKDISSPNKICASLVDVIIDKVIDLMNKDTTMSGFKKALVISAAKNNKEPVKKYILEMSKSDAEYMFNKVREIVK